MSVDSLLDSAFTTLLGKAIREVSEATLLPAAGAALRTVNVSINFSGGGVALPISGLPGLFEIPYPLTIVWVHMYAGDETGAPVVVTASVDLRLTSITSFGGSMAIYGATLPTLPAASAALIDTTDWSALSFVTGDTILYRLDSFVGTATWLTLTMQMRPTDVALLDNLTDNSANDVVDNDGNRVAARS